MAQMGHKSSKLALEVYAKRMNRDRDTGQGMDALVNGHSLGANRDSGVGVFAPEGTESAV